MYNDRIVWERLNEFGGIILSPGPGIPAQAGDLLRLIECCKHSHPLLGICLGHQALAEVFGASLSNLSGPLHGHSSVLKLLDCKEHLFSGLTEPSCRWTLSFLGCRIVQPYLLICLSVQWMNKGTLCLFIILLYLFLVFSFIRSHIYPIVGNGLWKIGWICVNQRTFKKRKDYYNDPGVMCSDSF